MNMKKILLVVLWVVVGCLYIPTIRFNIAYQLLCDNDWLVKPLVYASFSALILTVGWGLLRGGKLLQKFLPVLVLCLILTNTSKADWIPKKVCASSSNLLCDCDFYFCHPVKSGIFWTTLNRYLYDGRYYYYGEYIQEEGECHKIFADGDHISYSSIVRWTCDGEDNHYNPIGRWYESYGPNGWYFFFGVVFYNEAADECENCWDSGIVMITAKEGAGGGGGANFMNEVETNPAQLLKREIKEPEIKVVRSGVTEEGYAYHCLDCGAEPYILQTYDYYANEVFGHYDKLHDLQWFLVAYNEGSPTADLFPDGKVDLSDFAVFAENWKSPPERICDFLEVEVWE